MAGTVNPERFIRSKDRITLLLPFSGIQKIFVLVNGKHTDAVINTGLTCGICQEYFAVSLDNGRPFVDPETDAFPVVIGTCQQNLYCREFVGAFHLSNIKVADLLADADLLSPYIIPLAVIFKYGRIQGEFLK